MRCFNTTITANNIQEKKKDGEERKTRDEEETMNKIK